MVSYDFNHPILKKHYRYERLAKEHIAISKLKSNRIKVRITDSATKLKIPTKYEIDYHIRSIVGIEKDSRVPRFGSKHTIEISFPAKFPLESFIVKAITDIWHPNIIYHGEEKGKICGNIKGMGKAYNMRLLVERVGEIIQYKNYLAEHTEPYPFDPIVAKWVLEDAPKHRVNFPIDDSNLLEYTPPPEKEEYTPPPEPEKPKIIIKSIKTKEKKSGIIIKSVNTKRNSVE